MSDELPYMPMFVREVLGEVAGLDAEERGVHLSLQLASWSEGGSLPADRKRLARLCGTEAARLDVLWPAIEAFWHEEDGRIRNSRVSAELDRARGLQNARRKAAASTNAKRAAKRDGQRSVSDTPSETPSERTAARSAGRTMVANSGSGSGSGSDAGEDGGGGETAAADGEGEDLTPCLVAFRAARTQAKIANPQVTVAETPEDLREFTDAVGQLSLEQIAFIGEAAKRYFAKNGNRPADTWWRDNGWTLHLFSTQGLGRLLPDVEDDHRRAKQPRAPRLVTPLPAPLTDEQRAEINQASRAVLGKVATS